MKTKGIEENEWKDNKQHNDYKQNPNLINHCK